MEENKPIFKTTQIERQTPSTEKKIEKVVTGKVRMKKKSEVKKFADIFISEDISNVKSYILTDVLIPTIKKAISDIVTNGIDMLLYGSAGGSKKRSTVSKVSYGSFYEDPAGRRDYARASMGRNGFDYDEIIFQHRGDAEAVLTAIEDIIDQFGVVSVGDLYDLAEVSTTNFTINKYGWTDIHSAQVIRVRDGYRLKLPRALPLA